MLISVIVPVYNTKDYVEYTIEDIRDQSYKNIEIILVDDGSNDGCSEICDRFAQYDSRIRVIHTKNKGVSAARNTGLDYAHGEYIYFLDSDDRVHTEIIERMCRVATENDCKIVQASGMDFYDDKLIDKKKFEIIDNDKYCLYGREEMCYGNMENSIKASTVPQNKLYHKSVFSNGLRFEEGRIHEDVGIMYQLFWRCESIAVLDAELFFYRRKRPNSIMNSPYNLQRLDILYFEKERCDFFKANGNKILYDQALKCRYISAIQCIMSLKESDIFEKEKYIKAIWEEIKKEYPAIKLTTRIRIRSKLRIMFGLIKCYVIIMRKKIS